MQHPRSTLPQMLSCMDTLVQMDAARRLHLSKAISRRSEADLLGRQWKDTRDFLLALMPHHNEVRALLSGQKLAPFTEIQSAARQIAEEGAE
jgi:hypothetical protein